MGCASGQQKPLSPTSAGPHEGHEVLGPELEASKAMDAKQRAACTGATYASAPSQDLVSVDFQLRASIPSFSQPIQVCLLVDGRSLLTDNDALDAARHLAAGDSITIHARVTPGVRHQVVLRTDFDGLEPYRGYHFAVRSQKAILVAAMEGVRIVEMRLFELPASRLERRPTHGWSVSGPITLYDD